MNEIYFNGSANVTSLSFTSATHNVAGDVTAAWAPLENGPSPDGFGVFDFGLTDGVGENNPNIIMPGENIAFVFTVNAGLTDADFIVANGGGYLIAAKFTNGPDDPEDPGTRTAPSARPPPSPGCSASLRSALRARRRSETGRVGGLPGMPGPRRRGKTFPFPREQDFRARSRWARLQIEERF